MNESVKILVENLLEFMKKNHYRSIFVSDYIELTKNSTKWTFLQIATLHKAINQSKALELSYEYVDGVAKKKVIRTN